MVVHVAAAATSAGSASGGGAVPWRRLGYERAKLVEVGVIGDIKKLHFWCGMASHRATTIQFSHLSPVYIFPKFSS